MQTMKQVIVNEFGGPEKLILHDVPMPTAGDGQIVIKVEASGVNFSDGMQRRNKYVFPVSLPYLPGFEVAGIVTELGKGVENISVGDRVVAMLPGGGGYTQYAVSPSYLAAVIPPGISVQGSLALQVQGLTAYLMLKDGAKFQSGQTVLIHSAAGGVGTLLVQIAKQMGAGKIIATASNVEKLAVAKSLGADELINYTEPDWVQKVKDATGGQGVDLILDGTGGEILRNSFSCLAPFGRLISYGNPTGGSTSIEAFTLVNNNHILQGFGLASYFRKTRFNAGSFSIFVFASCNRETKSSHRTNLPFKRRNRSTQTNGKQENNR
jgi:NADPH2:quinone reductase